MRQLSVPKSELNEDNDTFWPTGDETDEVYVFVRFVQGNGAGPLGAYTNAVSGEF